MHRDLDLSINNVSKIEGHTALELKIRNGIVEDAKLKITENRRFYEQAIKGKNYRELPQMVSRICGTCSIAHLMAGIEAVEKALGYKPTPQAMIMKKLLIYGLFLRDHALHLYIFALPDLFNKDSLLEFDDKNELEHQLVHDAFDLKKAGNNLSTLIGGRAVHAPMPTVGGFLKIPTKPEIEKIISELQAVRPKVQLAMKTFAECPFKFERNTHFIGLTNNDFNFIEGEICSTQGMCIPEQALKNHLKEVVIPYSQSAGYIAQGKEYMVGSLARINLNGKNLHPNTQKDAAAFLKLFPSSNIFHNNLAQAIEMLHCIDASIDLLQSTQFQPEPPTPLTPKECEGVGVIEAPRGTLYYNLQMNAQGIITGGDIIVPTAQNQINLENDIKKLAQDKIDLPETALSFEIEKLIRAYDPCMSCACHFLKLKWI
ncbi:MAG TPA: nickel-dependent hydrogenase large subunit [Candidatus Gracilibacteria bacterium]|nr:nickel-dependent hydrogenase large subunit [Candidatus Gracilibacteria bacterium]HRY90928.1 nickel-dependent hydrogenase large subunit [Candidatus Gracilibacteria bacterium]